MKNPHRAFIALSILFCLGPIQRSAEPVSSKENIAGTKKDSGSVAVLELFTSQGCSSCPPADELLSKYTNREKESIFPISFHVDYWNRLGWKDIFSDPSFSERQEYYAGRFGLQSVYTPQIIINGSMEFTGSDKPSVAKAVGQALSQKATVLIQAEKLNVENQIGIGYTLTGNYQNNLINIALVETTASTAINAGENRGAVLRNYNVVRVWQTLPADIPKNHLGIKIPPDLALSNAKLILFTQDKKTWTVTGAAWLGF